MWSSSSLLATLGLTWRRRQRGREEKEEGNELKEAREKLAVGQSTHALVNQQKQRKVIWRSKVILGVEKLKK